MGIADRILLVLAVAAGAALAAPHLGFYSDDWTLVGQFLLTQDQSFAGLFSASYPHHYVTRPVQGLYAAALYKAFGLEPFGYHVVNAAVMAGITLLYGSVLTAVGVRRRWALAAALLYATTPAFSTARFWFAVSAAPLSVWLYLASLRVDLASASSTGLRLAAGRAASLALLATGLLAYEVTLPLAFFSPALARVVDHRAGGTPWSWRRWAAWGLPVLALLLSLGAYKATASDRLPALAGEPGRVERILGGLFRWETRDGDYGLNLPRAVAVNFGDHVLALPVHAARLPHRPVALALALALAAAVYLALGRGSGHGPRQGLDGARVAAAGAAVFVLGYAIFLTNTAIQITPTGVGNRTAMAAALGTPLVVVGVLGSVLVRVPAAWQNGLFAASVAAVSASGILVLSTLSGHWAEAYRLERAIVADIQRALPTPEPRTTLFLGGVCPYVGPAVVFESSWDLAFALRIAYREPTIAADVVSARFAPRPGNITTSLYGETYEWPYGPRTLLFDARTRRLSPLVDQAATRAALAAAGLPRTDCPAAREGVGVAVF